MFNGVGVIDTIDMAMEGGIRPTKTARQRDKGRRNGKMAHFKNMEDGEHLNT